MRVIAAWGLIVGWSALACGPIAVDRVVIRSEDYPTIEIVCQGEPVLAGEDCLAWAHQVLRSVPDLADTSVRIVLTNRDRRDRSCVADFENASGSIFASTDAACRVPAAG